MYIYALLVRIEHFSSKPVQPDSGLYLDRIMVSHVHCCYLPMLIRMKENFFNLSPIKPLMLLRRKKKLSKSMQVPYVSTDFITSLIVLPSPKLGCVDGCVDGYVDG